MYRGNSLSKDRGPAATLRRGCKKVEKRRSGRREGVAIAAPVFVNGEEKGPGCIVNPCVTNPEWSAAGDVTTYRKWVSLLQAATRCLPKLALRDLLRNCDNFLRGVVDWFYAEPATKTLSQTPHAEKEQWARDEFWMRGLTVFIVRIKRKCRRKLACP